jgi:SAM-dependent methyltransferase
MYYAEYPLKNQKITFSERIGYTNRLKLMQRQGIRNSHRILDYGCGAGLFVKFLLEKGFEQVFGYDRFVPPYDDPRALKQTYDAVVSYDVIEHDDHPREFLRGLSPLVRPGGIVVIGTPNADHVSIEPNGDPNLHPPYHRHILSERMLLALAREQGMEPVHIYRRSFYDSLFPTVNSRFMWRYIRKSGGFLDAAVEPPNTGLVLKSPEMVFLAFFGYFMPPGDNIIVSFRKAGMPPGTRAQQRLNID